jgi:hypothetical protein
MSNLSEAQHNFRPRTCDCLATRVQPFNNFGQPPYLYLRDSAEGIIFVCYLVYAPLQRR